MATAKFLHYNSYGGKNTRADINGVKENVEYIFSIDVLLLLALVGFIDGGAGLFFLFDWGGRTQSSWQRHANV